MKSRCAWLLVFVQISFAFAAKTDKESLPPNSKPLTLKNVNHPVLLNIKSAPLQNITKRIENPNAELIDFSIEGRKTDSDKILERIVADPTTSPFGSSYDHLLMDFSAYLSKPFVFDYSKVLSKAVEDAKSEVIATNYNLDPHKFEGINLNEKPFGVPKEITSRFTETLEGSQFGNGPHTKKLVRHQPGSVNSFDKLADRDLPVGFAFFDALEHNNRPYSQAFSQTSSKYTSNALVTQKPNLETTTSDKDFVYQTTTRQTNEAIYLDKHRSTTRDEKEERPPVTVNPSNFYRHFDSSNKKEANHYLQKPYFRGFTVDKSFDSDSQESAMQDSNDNADALRETRDNRNKSDESYDKPKFEYKEFNTNSYGTKPGIKFNKYSRIKVVQQAEPSTTPKREKHSKMKRLNQKKTLRISELASPSSKATIELDSSRQNDDTHYRYDTEVYHPSESNDFLIVVTPPSADSQSSASGHHFTHSPYSSLQKQNKYPKKISQLKTKEEVLPSFTTLAPYQSKSHKYLQYSPSDDDKEPSQPTTQAPSKSKQKRPFEMRYFQDIFSAQMSPTNFEFGHVMETPDNWEERYEKKDLATNRHQGKVRWGDKHGGFGEHYYDLNHHKPSSS